MTDDSEERIYPIIHRMVIWDERREDVFQKLEVNGITGEKAKQLYERARADRLAVIRVEGLKRAAVGVFWLLGGMGVFAAYWHWLGGITRQLRVLCGLAGAVGAWKLLDGLMQVIMAPSKRGSLADDL